MFGEMEFITYWNNALGSNIIREPDKLSPKAQIMGFIRYFIIRISIILVQQCMLLHGLEFYLGDTRLWTGWTCSYVSIIRLSLYLFSCLMFSDTWISLLSTSVAHGVGKIMSYFVLCSWNWPLINLVRWYKILENWKGYDMGLWAARFSQPSYGAVTDVMSAGVAPPVADMEATWEPPARQRPSGPAALILSNTGK